MMEIVVKDKKVIITHLSGHVDIYDRSHYEDRRDELVDEHDRIGVEIIANEFMLTQIDES